MDEEFLSESGLGLQHSAHAGLIPTNIDVSREEVIWEDLEKYHCYEGFFSDSLRSFRALRKSSAVRFRTAPEAVRAVAGKAELLQPTALIFHAGRSGSTILARALARSRANLLVSEAPPHNEVWRLPLRPEYPAAEFYRNLTLAMGRRRIASYRAHIIKFTSFNIVHFSFIREVFPEVPALFLFRDPTAILRSFERTPPGWLGKDLGHGFRPVSLAAAIEAFFLAAIEASTLCCLDYSSITPGTLPSILRHLELDPDPGDLALMTNEFRWDAKNRRGRREWVSSNDGHRVEISPSLRSLYRELKKRERLLP